jgi:hypothetical protein
MCINEAYTKSAKVKSDVFAIQNGLKEVDALLPLLFKIAAEYAIRKGQENQKRLTHVSYWSMLTKLICSEKVNTTKANRESPLEANREAGLECKRLCLVTRT